MINESVLCVVCCVLCVVCCVLCVVHIFLSERGFAGKRDEMRRDEMRRDETKRNETKRNETKRNETNVKKTYCSHLKSVEGGTPYGTLD